MRNLIKPTNKIIELFFDAWNSANDEKRLNFVEEIMSELKIDPTDKSRKSIYSIMKKSGTDDDKIEEVFEKYGNNNEDDVLYRVLILDSLYSTQIADPISIARGILSIENIDNRLNEGDLSLVEEIEKCGNKRDEYSFATKYCSWSNKKNYVIYDNIVGHLLLEYNKQYKFCDKLFFLDSKKRCSLRKYKDFFEVYQNFTKFYNLDTSNGYKKIDIFLWAYGKIIEQEKNENK